MKRVIILTIIAILVVFTLAFANNSEIINYETYIVQQGDTLWDIAKMSNGYSHMDIREIIYDIQQASNITADLQSGDVLQIPVYAD